MTIDLGQIRLENTTPPHNKFYEIQFWHAPDDDPSKADFWEVVTLWGRFGSHGRTGKRIFFNKLSAVDYIRNLIITRVKHGYHAVGIPTLKLNDTHG